MVVHVWNHSPGDIVTAKSAIKEFMKTKKVFLINNIDKKEIRRKREKNDSHERW